MSRYDDPRHGSRDGRKRSASPAESPVRKRRPLAADYFEPDDAPPRRQHAHDSLRGGEHGPNRTRDSDQRDGDDGRLRKHRHHHHHHHHHKHHHKHHRKEHASSSKRKDAVPVALPSQARALSYKHDFDAFEPLFANYLDIQKGKDLYEMDDHEQKGRWKSFVHRWNRGELAEGWYDPEMFERIVKEAPPRPEAGRRGEEPVWEQTHMEDSEQEDEYAAEEGPISTHRETRSDGEENDGEENDDDDDDDYGPPPPPGAAHSARKGPGIPSSTDLALQREAAAQDLLHRTADLRLARQADRAAQREALDELVPRAEPGTRERKLEKKAAVNDKMRSFRDGRGEAMEEVDDGELMGGGDGDGVAAFRKRVAAMQRKKTDRELRREEDARARLEEREERLKEWREREEDKMRGLKELAKARFG